MARRNLQATGPVVKVTFQLPKDLNERLQREANRRGISKNWLVVSGLASLHPDRGNAPEPDIEDAISRFLKRTAAPEDVLAAADDLRGTQWYLRKGVRDFLEAWKARGEALRTALKLARRAFLQGRGDPAFIEPVSGTGRGEFFIARMKEQELPKKMARKGPRQAFLATILSARRPDLSLLPGVTELLVASSRSWDREGIRLIADAVRLSHLNRGDRDRLREEWERSLRRRASARTMLLRSLP